MEVCWKLLSLRGSKAILLSGLFFHSAISLRILKEFMTEPPMQGAGAVLLVDTIKVIRPPELSLNMTSISTFIEWLQERLGIEHISLNKRKLQAL